jgi:hypothetical protein
LVPLDETQFVEIRIGLHCGDAVGGITGRLTPRYCFFGETINIANKIESSGYTNRIHISPAFASVIKHLPRSDAYELIKREDPVEIKGKEKVQTYWLENSPDVDIDKIYFETFQYIQKLIREFKTSMPEILALIAGKLDVNSDVTPVFTTSFPSRPSNDSLSTLPLSPLTPTLSDFSDMCTFEYEILMVPDDAVSITNHIMGIFEGIFDLNSVNVDKRVLSRFIMRVSRSYRTIPYHNFFHAFCVVQFTAALLVQCDLTNKLPHKELFCLLICALIHDVDHPGTNNSFEIATKSRLSIMYNDISVLENHHIALGFSIMQSCNDYNVISQWTAEEQRVFRQLAIHNILVLLLQLTINYC